MTSTGSRKWTAPIIAALLAFTLLYPTQAHKGASKFTPAQAKTLYDWSHAEALDTATWGGPLVIMYTLRYNDAVGPKVKAAPNSLWRMENITTPSIAEREGYVLPNDSVLNFCCTVID